MAETKLQVVIDAQNNATAAFASVEGNIKSLSASGATLSGAFSTFGSHFGTEAKIAEVGLVGLVGAIGYGVKAAMSFNEQMTLIQTQAGGSAEEVQKMSAAILDMGGTATQTPEELSKGLYHIESAGLRGADALDMLKVAAQGATVGQADLESVTNALAATNASGIGGVNGYKDAMGQLNGIVGAGNMRMQDLADSMGTGILSSSKAFGVSLSDVGAALATMTTQGVPAIDAATRLRMTFSLMGAPTSKATKELATIGIGATDLADKMRGPGGLGSALEELKTHLDNSGKSATEQAIILSKAFGGGKSSSAIMSLVQNTGMFDDKLKQIKNSTNDFGAAVERTQEDPMTKFKDVMAGLQTVAIKLGNAALPVINDALEKLITYLQQNQDMFKKVADYIVNTVIPAIASFTKFIMDHHVAILAVIAVWEALKVTFAVVELISGISKAFTILSAASWVQTIATGAMTAATWLFNAAMLVLTSPIGLVVLAIIAVIAIGVLLYKHWDVVSAKAKELGSGIATVFGNIGNSITNGLKWAINGAIDLINGFIKGVDKIQMPDWVPGMGGKGINIPQIPRLDVGTNFVPQDMLAVIHKGEAVVPAKYNPANNQQGSSGNDRSGGNNFTFNMQGAIIGDKNALINMVKDAISRQQEQVRLGIV